MKLRYRDVSSAAFAGFNWVLFLLWSSYSTAFAQPNLTPYQPVGWTDKIVVATTQGTTTDSSLMLATDTLFVNWAVLNNGTVPTPTGFTMALYVDGAFWENLNRQGQLVNNTYHAVQDYAIGSLAVGIHTLRIMADSTGVIAESDETDNDYTKTIRVGPPVIRVDPLTLTFTGSQGAQRQPQGQMNGSPTTPVSLLPDATISAVPADKLIDPLQIAAELAKGPTVSVIVNLAMPGAVLHQANFASQDSLRALHPQIKNLQQAVLDGIPGAHLKLRHRFENVSAFSAEVTAEGLRALQAHPGVSSVEPVYALSAHLAQGIPLIHGMTYRSSFNGAGVAIAICDTGIDCSHPRLGGAGFPNSKVIGGYDFGDGGGDPIPNGQPHGTCCAGIAAGDLGTVGDYIGGVAPNAKIYSLKISSGTTSGATSDAMVAAWDWCVTHKNDNPSFPIVAISTSFGGGRYYVNCDTEDPAMTAAANNAVAAGITVLASSGNDGYCDSIAWPACISSVIAVGGVYDAAYGPAAFCVDAASCATPSTNFVCQVGMPTEDVSAPDKVTPYSNTASFLGLLAPASQCYTLDLTGSAGYWPDAYDRSFEGTSAACPYAAGAVACLQSAAKALTGAYLSVADVRNRLVTFGDSVTDSKAGITTPRVNLGRAIQSLPNSSQTIRVYNDGGGTLAVNSISQETPAPWVTFAPTVPFSILGGGFQDVTVNVDLSQTSVGLSTNHLLITSSDAAHSPYPEGVYIVANRTNTPPTISAIADQSTIANAALGPIAVTVNDAETPASSLTLSASSSDPTLVPIANIAFGGSGGARTVTITPASNQSGACTITLTVSDGATMASESVGLTVYSAVVGRFIFYNGSAFDGNDAAANAKDDAAIAPDKAPLFPGGIAMFSNYTSYSRGINGIIVDIAGLRAVPTVSDFSFQVGNNNSPSGWAAAPAPTTIAVRHAAGTNGSERVTLIWPDNAVQKQWLRVTVLASQNTGLAVPDFFYFGNAIAESGNSLTDAQVDVSDQNAARIHPRTFLNPAPLDYRYDYNRDQRVDVSDQNLARINGTTFLNALKLIDLR